MNKHLIIEIFTLLIYHTPAVGQTLDGMSTGNYAGIAGLNFNPASIVDSRYKFDLNIAGGQYFFNNNYLLANPLIFARRINNQWANKQFPFSLPATLKRPGGRTKFNNQII